MRVVASPLSTGFGEAETYVEVAILSVTFTVAVTAFWLSL